MADEKTGEGTRVILLGEEAVMGAGRTAVLGGYGGWRCPCVWAGIVPQAVAEEARLGVPEVKGDGTDQLWNDH